MVVNALEEEDITIFCIALIEAMNQGKNFLFRTAATFTKIIGDISSRPLLTKEELIDTPRKNGGLVIVGSHVKKTTQQLEALKEIPSLHFIEFDVHLVLEREKFQEEINRIRAEAEKMITDGITTVVYTK